MCMCICEWMNESTLCGVAVVVFSVLYSISKLNRTHMIRSQMDLYVNNGNGHWHFSFIPAIPINHLQSTRIRWIIKLYCLIFRRTRTQMLVSDIVCIWVSIVNVCVCCYRLDLWFSTRHFGCIMEDDVSTIWLMAFDMSLLPNRMHPLRHVIHNHFHAWNYYNAYTIHHFLLLINNMFANESNWYDANIFYMPEVCKIKSRACGLKFIGIVIAHSMRSNSIYHIPL